MIATSPRGQWVNSMEPGQNAATELKDTYFSDILLFPHWLKSYLDQFGTVSLMINHNSRSKQWLDA